MRNIGDLNWLNDYIGVPYEFNGRSMKGLDCYGLPKIIMEYEFGIVLPDWSFDKLNIREISGEMVGAVDSGDFTQHENPEEGDFAVCYRKKAAHHMGMYFGGGVIHCAEGLGVVYQPRDRFEKVYTHVVYGEWTP